MTIINPNSIAGITSVTAQADVINFFKSNGALAGLQLNGVNFNTTNGISTFNNLTVGGTLTYEDVKNVDSVGIISARTAIHVGAGISAVGIITATAFKLSDGTAVGGVTSDAQENTIGGTDAGSVLDSDTYRNTLFGYQAGEQINSGDDNTCIGWKAADKLTSGSKNCAVGSEALENISSGSDNVAMGWEAGRSLTSGSGNVMLGNMAGRTMSGNDNIAIGDHAYSNGGGTRSIGMGGQAVFLGGTDVIGLGYYASARSCTGSIGIGYYAGRNNVGDYNIYLGYESGKGTSSSPYANGDNNIGMGYRSLYAITTAESTVAIGRNALSAITSSNDNTAVGHLAGEEVTGWSNTAFGYGALASGVACEGNVAIGRNCVASINSGDYNIGIGYEACRSNFSAPTSYSIGIGYEACKVVEGTYNIGIGWRAGKVISSGADNTILGSGAGITLATGSNNLILGHDAAASSTSVSNEITLGDSNITKFRIPGINLSIDSDGVKFNGDTAAANGLDDYEEGSYSSSIVSANCTLDSSSGTGYYVKVGDMVTVRGLFSMNTQNGSPAASGSTAIVQALPFTPKNTGIHVGTMIVENINSGAPTSAVGHPLWYNVLPSGFVCLAGSNGIRFYINKIEAAYERMNNSHLNVGYPGYTWMSWQVTYQVA